MIREFTGDAGTFSAFSNAQRFLSARGFTMGLLDGSKPVAVLLEYRKLGRWSEMSKAERDRLDGEIRSKDGGNPRRGTVLVEIYDHRAAALAAFNSTPGPQPMSERALVESTYDGPIPEAERKRVGL